MHRLAACMGRRIACLVAAALLACCCALLCPSLSVVPLVAALTSPPEIYDAAGNLIPNYAFAQIQYVSVTKIDGVEQSFSSDFYMLTTWAAPKHSENVTTADDLNALSDSYWQPQLDFINAIGGITALVDDALGFVEEPSFDVQGLWNYTLPEGWIWCTNDNRYVGDFLTPVEMQNFPYDQQSVTVKIESFWDNKQVKIVFAEPAKINLEGLIPETMPDITGWHLNRVDTIDHDIFYSYNSRSYNRLELAIVLDRLPEFYLNKLVAGCIMLVAMCISLFFLTAEEADRLMGALAIFAGLVAYLFVASVYTPVLPYSTALDKFLMLCFVSVIAQSGVHGVMFFLREREKLEEEKAEALKQLAEAETSDDDDDDETEDELERDTKHVEHHTHIASPSAAHSVAPVPIGLASATILPPPPSAVASPAGAFTPRSLPPMTVKAPASIAMKPINKAQVAPMPDNGKDDSIPVPQLAFHEPSTAGGDEQQNGAIVTSVQMPLVRTTTKKNFSRANSMRHGHDFAAASAKNTPRDGEYLNKRARKRLRKQQARLRQVHQQMAAEQAVATAAVTQRTGGVLEVRIMNSFNPIRIWWASLGLTRIRKMDVAFAAFFSLSFILATAIIFGIPLYQRR